MRPAYPAAPRLDLVEAIHGVPVADPYRWLEDPAAAETQAWSRAQDELAAPYLAGLGARPWFHARLEELLRIGSVSAPTWRGERCFFTRRDPEQEHAVLWSREPDGAERVVVDPMRIDPTGKTTLDVWKPSREGDLLAYQLSSGGDEEARLFVVEVGGGGLVDGPVDRCRYSPIAWVPGGAELYYVRRLPPGSVPDGEERYHRRVYRHRLGTDADREDEEIFGAGLEMTNYYLADVSLDGRWLVVTARQGTSPHGDLYIADRTGDGRLETIAERSNTSAWVGHDGRLYAFTRDGSPRGRLAVTSPTRPGAEHWRDLIPQGEAVLEWVALAEGGVVAGWQRDCVTRVELRNLETGEPQAEAPLPGLGTAVGVTRPEGGGEAWILYTDFGEPGSVYRWDLAGGDLELWARPPGWRPADLRARQVFFPSKDGTRVPMFLLRRPDFKPGEAAPAILTGYGGFNVSNVPAHNVSARAWIEAGGLYAIANLRGGGEYGEEWHEAGMREHKQNVFDDFIAAADWLVAGGHTTRERLAIVGGSNGGLLVGAALTQRPDMCQAVVCSAPLLDMVRYERFGLGATWNHEYGRADDPVEFGWLYEYSPYHRVREGVDYPAVLFTLFDSDTRVDPMHGRKLCAALQHATASARPVLLRREGDVGHGARAASRAAALAADNLAFVAEQVGLALPTPAVSG